MKRKDLLEHLRKEGCLFLREGRKHSIYYNPVNRRTSTVARHNEIPNTMAIKICKDLGISKP